MRTLSCDSGFTESEENEFSPFQEYLIPGRSFSSQDYFSTFQDTLEKMGEEKETMEDGEQEINEDFSLDFLLESSRLVEDHSLENLETKPGRDSEICETDCDITYCDSTTISSSPSSPTHSSFIPSSPSSFTLQSSSHFASSSSPLSTGFSSLLPCTPPYSPLSSSPSSSFSLDSWSSDEWRGEGGWRDGEWKGEIKEYDWTNRKESLEVDLFFYRFLNVINDTWFPNKWVVTWHNVPWDRNVKNHPLYKVFMNKSRIFIILII